MSDERPASDALQASVATDKIDNDGLFRSVFENAAIGMTLVDLDGRLVRCNAAFARMLGYAADALAGMPFSAITHPDDVDANPNLYRDLVAGKLSQFQIDKRYLHKSGEIVRARLTVSAVLDEGSAVRFTIGMTEDITAQEEAKRSLQVAHHRLKVLSARILDAQESERRTIALELHDEIGQALSAIKLHLHDLRKSSRNEQELQNLQSAMSITELAFGHIRRLAVQLRPPQLDLMGLESALRSHLESRAAEAGLALSFDCRLGGGSRGPRLDITCFRLVQEAMTNIIRHAQAASVVVSVVEREGALHLRIKDDGVGFDVEEAKVRSLRASSMGLAGMEERVHLLNGTFDIVSSPGKGTEIRARLLPSILERERRSRAR